MRIQGIFAVALSLCVLGGFADAKKDIDERIAKNNIRNSGGWVIQPNTGSGCVKILNSQSKVPIKAIRDGAALISEQYSVRTSVEEATNAGQTPLIHVVSGGAASPMAWYPDEDKVVLDVDPLLKDGAAEDVVTRRVAKEVFRAFGFLLGGGFVYYDKSLLAPLRTLKDVDRADIALPMEMRFQQNSPALGISPYRRVLYRKACEEGWAHSPTNKAQQRIWDRVHAVPKNPMKIEFDPKKGR